MSEETIAALSETIAISSEIASPAFELPVPDFATFIGWEYVPIILFFILIMLVMIFIFGRRH